MKIKHFFYLISLLLFLVWGLILFILPSQNNSLFFITEGVITISLIALIIFYRKVVKPLEIIANGMELLKEQDFSSRLKPVGQVEADKIVEIFNRMMSQLKEERLKLREQNHFLDLLVSASPMGVIIFDFDNKISMINNAAKQFLGMDKELKTENISLKDIGSMLASDLDKLKNNQTETIRLSNSEIYRCSRLTFLDRGFAHPFILIESLTKEVMKAEKKAYEKVIRMIAHEVNNTVAGITSTLDTVENALESVNDSEDLREVMRVCIERGMRLSNFISSFANVVKIPEPQFEMIDLNERVSACKIFMENICRNNNIAITLDLCEESPEVNIDTTLFEQVMLNIIKNSAESIGNNGNITIKTSVSPVMLEITDDGKGISKEVEPSLFTPFFSTKPNGQGIGLIFIRDVLLKHNCSFTLKTYGDKKTRFSIRFKE